MKKCKKIEGNGVSNIKESLKLTTLGFTLVELLAVIVILAIILVIAVPKVMDVIKDSKKATIESTAKVIAGQAEKKKVQNTLLGKAEEIDCEDVAKINDVDYEYCSIEFDENTAKVTLVGSGKFEGLNVCEGTKTDATAVDTPCKGVCTENEVLTEIKNIIIKNKTTCNTYITTKVTGTDYVDVVLPLIEPLCNGENVDGMNTDQATNYLVGMGLFTREELITNNVIEEQTNKYCKPNLPEKGTTYISRIYNDPATGLMEPIIKYTKDNKEKEVNAGIRYTGANPNNKVYYNCEEKDTNNVSYGSENYDYASSCEVWRIIGVFNVEDGNGNIEKRMKIINTSSTFSASWDSSRWVSSTDHVNLGDGINQWGASKYSDGSSYEGADLMRLLNGYYIGKSGSTCRYCNENRQEICEQVCDTEENTLASKKMKPLTSIAKSMTKNAVWDTYAVETYLLPNDIYLQEKGLTAQHTGKSMCVADGGGDYCNDNVERTTSWTGIVGLMSIYDIYGANGWLYDLEKRRYPWSISPIADYLCGYDMWYADSSSAGTSYAYAPHTVWPALYLNPNIQIIGGDGSEGNAYKLKA